MHARKAVRRGLGLLFVSLLFARDARAWVYSEHRQIAGEAIAKLDANRRARLDALWAEARRGHEDRLCESSWAGPRGKTASCLDFAAFSALAADHSCSADDLVEIVLRAPWVLPAHRVGEEMRERLAAAKRGADRLNTLAWSNLELESTDPGYSSRAGANNAHFLLSRQGNEDVLAHLERALSSGTELNAAGNFAYEHDRALDLVRAREIGNPDGAKRTDRALRILAAEAYGLHFLEDIFAAGHVAGTWGGAADRKGTHDFYNETGLDVVTWNGERAVLLGDGWMRDEDLTRAAHVVGLALEQLLDTLAEPPGTEPADQMPLDTCHARGVPNFVPTSIDEDRVAAILEKTPVPGRASGLGALPRFRSEIGPFVGVAGSGALSGSSTASGSSGARVSGSGTISVGLRAGLGLDSLIGESADGLAFLEGGILQQTRQENACSVCEDNGLLAYAPGIPARSGLHVRLRLPFCLVPGDLILGAPLLFLSPDLYKRMAIHAADGGLLGLQRGIATRFGRFQLVLGRELGATFFGYVGGEDRFLAPVVLEDGTTLVLALAYRSLRLELPVVEYRPFREFATHQAFTVLAQLGAGVDIPQRLRVATPQGEVSLPPEGSFGFVYVRLAFDWRRYF